jgi:hypothetical protein
MNAVEEKPGTVALLEATAEARALIEDLTRLSEELKLREERLGELLAPSEAALRARTEYLDKVTRDELSRAEQQVLKLAEEVARIARNLNDSVVQIPARLAEAVPQRGRERERRGHGQTLLGLAALLLGGFLAGQVASCRSGTMNAKPPSLGETGPTKSAPPVPRRPPGSGTRPRAAPAR